MDRRARLSIAIFPEYFYPHVGGAETWTANIAKHLNMLGHDVSVFTYRMPKATKTQTLFGVRVNRIGRPFVISGPRPYFRRFLIHFFGTFLTVMTNDRFDIVLGQYTPLLPLKFVCRIKGIPVVAIFHDVYGLDSSIRNKGVFRGLIRYIFGDLLITRLHYDGIVVVSNATKQKLWAIRSPINKIAIVRNGVDMDSIDSVPRQKSGAKLVCYVGRLIRHKHVDDLLRAFAMVLLAEPRSELDIVGDGEEKEELLSLSRDLGIDRSVKFEGFADEIEKVRLMKASSVLVLPSYEEGWGNVVTEAVYAGLRVVAYAIPALKEQAQFFENISLVPRGDIDGLAKEIIHSLQDGKSPEHDRQIVRSHFSWERSAADLEEFLQYIVKMHVAKR